MLSLPLPLPLALAFAFAFAAAAAAAVTAAVAPAATAAAAAAAPPDRRPPRSRATHFARGACACSAADTFRPPFGPLSDAAADSGREAGAAVRWTGRSSARFW